MPPRLLIAFDFFDRYRPYVYMALFGLSQIYAAYKFWLAKQVEEQEMQILQSSFELEGKDDATGGLLALAGSFGDDEEGDVI